MKDLSNYDYLVVSAYKPRELRKMDKKKSLSLVGLYDGSHFEQAVICPICGKEMCVLFNKMGEPDVAQCMEITCNELRKVYYTTARNFNLPWKKAGV